ncbi:MAG: ADP-ribosylation factor-like protein [Verrucomicrobiota bacterium]
MAVVNEETSEVQFKIFFTGAAMSGKTSNLTSVHQRLAENQRGDLVSLNTSTDRTLFFDFLPVNPVLIEGYKTRFQIYTVPGQVVYNATRELVLRGADGLVFVVDSMPARLQENIQAFEGLAETLQNNGTDIGSLPLVLQYNKRDLPDAMPLDDLNRVFNPNGNVPFWESIANQGMQVMELLDALSTEILRRFHRQKEKASEAPAAPRRPNRKQPASSSW